MQEFISYKKTLSILCCFIIALFIEATAQQTTIYKNAVELNSDNDAYAVSENNDRYYSFGTGLKFYFTAEKLLGLEKLFSKKEHYFFTAGIRSEGFTPTRFDYDAIPEEDLNFDRPFAGLLFATFDANYVFDRSFFKTELYIGVLGPSSKAEEIQNWIHKNITSDDLIKGWQYQIPNQFLFNINFQGVYALKTNPTWLDLYIEGNARLGNLYIDATPTFGIRLGKFNKLTTSLSNAILSENVKPELYFKSSFSYSFVAFDATAQGNLFGSNYKYAIDNMHHCYTSITAGVFINYKKFAVGYENVFNFGKLIKGSYHNFAKLNFNFRF